MTQEEINNFYDNVVLKANEIVNKLGNSLYSDDMCYANEYKYDKLRIVRSNDCIQIFIGDEEVLFCNTSKRQKSYKKGKWPDVIDVIYDEIPNILEKREYELNNNNQKLIELNSLEDFLKYYIECYHKKPDMLRLMNISLAMNQISVFREMRVWNEVDIFNNYTNQNFYYVFTILNNGEKVAEFLDNKYDMFPNQEYYLDKYKSGEWLYHFKNIIKETMYIDEEITKERINNNTDEIIKNLKKEIKR